MLGFLRNLASSPLIQRMLGGDLAAALDDQSYTIYVKGSKMSQAAEFGFTVYDLDAGTVTLIDTDRRTFTVETFADLRSQIERAEQWMKHPNSGPVPFDVSVQQTDQKQMFDGRPATKALITLSAQSEDAWGKPVVNVQSWLSPVNASTRPLYNFAKRAAGKLSSVFTLIPSVFGAAGESPGSTTGDLQKLRGVSVLDQIAVTGVTTPLAGLLGNRDGQENKPVIVLEIQSTNFLDRPIDSAKFAVPAGYRQEQQRR